MTEEIGKDIGSKIGRVLEVDKRAMQVDQAKFLRIRVEVLIDKPLRRGGYVKNEEGGRYWVDFRYERLLTFCYICGILGHDEKHCQLIPMEKHSRRQYGEWLKVGGAMKNEGEKEKMKLQSKAERWSSPSPVVGGRASEVDSGVSMMDAAPLDTMKGTFTSNHREQEKQIR